MTPDSNDALAAIAGATALRTIIAHTDFEMIWDTKPESWRIQLHHRPQAGHHRR
jgi:hypothetical protein